VTLELAISVLDIAHIVGRELEAGERLLWSGQPAQGIRLRKADALAIPFSLLWTGLFIFWETSVIRSGAPLFVRLWGIPFLLVGAYLVAGRFFVDAWQRTRTVYAVTDRRVIVVSGVFTRCTTSHALRTLPAITLSERHNGEGDVVLADTDMNHVATGGLVARGSSVPPALEFVPNVRGVYEIVREAWRLA
jgi:hypothetical protein